MYRRAVACYSPVEGEESWADPWAGIWEGYRKGAASRAVVEMGEPLGACRRAAAYSPQVEGSSGETWEAPEEAT